MDRVKKMIKKTKKTNQDAHFLLSLLNISLFLKNYEKKNSSLY